MSTNLKAILGGIVVIIVFGLAIWKFDTQKMVSDDKKADNYHGFFSQQLLCGGCWVDAWLFF